MLTNGSKWFQAGKRELPYAEDVIESQANPWAWLRDVSGSNSSETNLLQLARRSMLSLWSIPSPYTTEGMSRSGTGKELCDLLVVFGDDVLLFSDKDCSFSYHVDINVAWSRWYRRAIEKSAKQLIGAEKALRRPGIELFTSATCQQSIPLSLPDPSRMRVHLIAVAHGAVKEAERFWKSYGGQSGSSGSLMVNTELVGPDHATQPFQVGWPLGKEHFIHVLDDLTLNLLMNELNTVADFTNYLVKKEQLLRYSGCEFLIPGEEDLLAAYVSNLDQESRHCFPEFERDSTVVLREGGWKRLLKHRSYKSHVARNSLSYLWDDLIEYQASHMIHGSSEERYVGEPRNRRDNSSERVLRMMASEDRRTRRLLGETIRIGRELSSDQKRFLRTVIHPNKRLFYCFIFLPHITASQTFDEYRQYRQYLLHLYCEGALLRFKDVKQIIGIALPPYDTNLTSVDFLLCDVHANELSETDRLKLEEDLSREGIWNIENIANRDRSNEASGNLIHRILNRFGLMKNKLIQ